MTFTPGPWHVKLPAKPMLDAPSVMAGKYFVVEEVEGYDAAAREATARLIAAAPDLIEAGEVLIDALVTAAPVTTYPKIVRDAMTQWLNARAKAKGTPSAP